MLSINSSEYVFRRYETLKSWNFLTWCLQGKMTISKNDAPQNSRYDPATSHTFLSLHIENSDSWSLNIIMTTVMNSVNFDNPHRNCVYILYTKVVRDVYNWCIQNVYKMYTTFRQTTHFVYKIERTMAAKFCMQNVYKSLLKCGIRFV